MNPAAECQVVADALADAAARALDISTGKHDSLYGLRTQEERERYARVFLVRVCGNATEVLRRAVAS